MGLVIYFVRLFAYTFVLHIVHIQPITSLGSKSCKINLSPPQVNINLRAISGRKPQVNLTTGQVELPSTYKDFEFICNASYPVEWVFQTALVNQEWKLETTRYAEDIYNETTFTFSSRLFFEFKSSMKEANQTCRSLQYPDCLQTQVNTRRSGNSGNQTLRIRIFQGYTGKIIKESPPALGQNADCSIRFMYIFSTQSLCCVSDTQSNLSIGVADTPNGCYDPTSCRQHFSLSSCSSEYLDTAYAQVESDFNCERNGVQFSLSPSSADIYGLSSVGVFFCRSDSSPTEFSSALHYTYTLPPICPEDPPTKLPTPYFINDRQSHSYPLHEFVSFCQHKDFVYAGETVQFECLASTYHFSNGLRWMFKRKSADDEVLPYIPETIEREQAVRKLSSRLVINDTDIFAIVCLIPVRNSFEWYSREVHLTVLDPTEISFSGGNDEVTVKYEPNTVIRCQANGKPIPELSWRRNGKPIKPSLKISMIQNPKEVWTELIFPGNVSQNPEIFGDYTCIAKNQLEVLEKVFSLQKERRLRTFDADDDSGTTLGLAIGIPISLIVMIIIGLLIWKIFKQNERLRLLTKAEIDEFMNGRPDMVSHSQRSTYSEVNTYAAYLPYNKNYEVLKDQFEIDKDAILGSGQYGLVLKGFVRTKASLEKIQVAIKTVKPLEDITYFKALLSELKIMTFIGKHANIVNLIGAHTSNIQNREVYIAIEFCQNGNLLNYLRRNRSQFTDLIQEDGRLSLAETSFSPRKTYGTVVQSLNFTTFTLIKWATEIASGMDFLGGRKVIHGDLASRNILLTTDLTAKICDFGLSRQLFEYANYIKKNQTPLPWKWLAVECLQDMQFSVKSDVWAYGITLWEIFSLGHSPYPGRVYNDEFLTALEQGDRPKKPQHANTEMYQIMLSCWAAQTKDRPTFLNLRGRLEHLTPLEYMILQDLDEQEENENQPSTKAQPKESSEGYLIPNPSEKKTLIK